MAQSSRALQFHSWCVRAPWAVFGLAPLLLLAGAYFIACLYLWSVWTIFLPGADTPFGVRWTGPPYGLQNLSFQFGKFYYFGAPILVGWAIGFAAARQRMKAIWPTVGLLLVALMGGTAEIHASRNSGPRRARAYSHGLLRLWTLSAGLLRGLRSCLGDPLAHGAALAHLAAITKIALQPALLTRSHCGNHPQKPAIFTHPIGYTKNRDQLQPLRTDQKSHRPRSISRSPT